MILNISPGSNSYALQWLVEKPADELAQSILKDSSLSFPLRVCPEIEKDRKNVLVYADGSEASYRAVDHVGYILSNQGQHSICLFHVKTSAVSNKAEVFNRSIEILRTHSINDERINTKSSWGFSVPGTIMDQVNEGGFAAVALGLNHEKHERLLIRQLKGEATSRLIRDASNFSVWCC